MKKLHQDILNKIKEYDKIIIFSHKRSDGDCVGSNFGLGDIIRTTYPDKGVYHLGEYTKYLSFVGKFDIIGEENNDFFADCLGIIVDTATNDRVYDQRFLLCKELIKFDHHEDSEIPCDLYDIQPNSPANCQILTEFLIANKKELKISLEGVTALYTGLYTDTGGFKYRGVSSKTFKVASYLVSKGASPVDITAKLNSNSLESLKYLGYVYNNIETKGKFIYCKITKQVIEDYKISYEDASSIVNYLGGIKEYPSWALFIELPDNSYRARVRSYGINLVPLATAYGGGGHENAVGIEMKDYGVAFNFINDLVKYLDETVNS